VSAQLSLFDPKPCRQCQGPMKPHWLPNYQPPVWTQDHESATCGPNLYAPTREGLVGLWNENQEAQDD
jgi:hypothetical protein